MQGITTSKEAREVSSLRTLKTDQPGLPPRTEFHTKENQSTGYHIKLSKTEKNNRMEREVQVKVEEGNKGRKSQKESHHNLNIREQETVKGP